MAYSGPVERNGEHQMSCEGEETSWNDGVMHHSLPPLPLLQTPPFVFARILNKAQPSPGPVPVSQDIFIPRNFTDYPGKNITGVDKIS